MTAMGRIWAVLALAALVAGCQSVQTTRSGAVGIERTQRMSQLISEGELRAGAAQAYSEVLGKERARGKLNANPALTARVRAITDRLIPVTAAFRTDAPGWQWEVNVIESEDLNAWCMPGGKIAIYSGLVTRLALSDAEIAAIVGHEIAHALREHARERASERLMADLLLSGAAAIVGGGAITRDVAGLAYSVTVAMPNSRAHETEADRMGVELAARAGYDPRAAISVWQKMARVGGAKPPEFLSTHPSADTRLRDLEIYAARVMPLYEAARR